MHRLIAIACFVLCACRPAVQRNETASTATLVSAVAPDTVGKINRTEAEWKSILTPEQYHVLREKGTDSPFMGELTFNEKKGTYYCAACGNALFTSDMKFNSACGWPSFDREIAGGKVKTQIDSTYGMIRTEIMCARCGSHLGHLFDDGPTLTGQRYCVNSTSLEFKKEK